MEGIKIFKNKFFIFLILSLMFLSVSAVCAEDSASLDLNETNIDIETPVSTSTDVVADEQEVCEYSNEDIVYASEITPGESSSNDINLSSYKVSYEKEITNGPVKAATAGTIYVNPTTGNDANTGTSWSTAVKTITGALSLVKDGGVICLANGEHTEAATITKNVALNIFLLFILITSATSYFQKEFWNTS